MTDLSQYKVQVDPEQVAIEKSMLTVLETHPQPIGIKTFLNEVIKANNKPPDYKIRYALIDLMGNGKIVVDSARKLTLREKCPSARGPKAAM